MSVIQTINSNFANLLSFDILIKNANLFSSDRVVMNYTTLTLIAFLVTLILLIVWMKPRVKSLLWIVGAIFCFFAIFTVFKQNMLLGIAYSDYIFIPLINIAYLCILIFAQQSKVISFFWLFIIFSINIVISFPIYIIDRNIGIVFLLAQLLGHFVLIYFSLLNLNHVKFLQIRSIVLLISLIFAILYIGENYSALYLSGSEPISLQNSYYGFGYLILFLIYLFNDTELYHRQHRVILHIFVLALAVTVIASAVMQRLILHKYLDTIYLSMSPQSDMLAKNVLMLSDSITFMFLVLQLVTFLLYLLYVLTSAFRAQIWKDEFEFSRLLFHQAGLPFLLFQETRATTVNAIALEYFGGDKQKIINKEFSQIFFDTDGAPLQETVGIPTGASAAPFTFKKADGSISKCFLEISSFKKDDIDYSFVIIKDVKKMKSELQIIDFIQNLISILLENQYWQAKVNQIGSLIEAIYEGCGVYIYLQGYEGSYKYGKVQTDHATDLRQFYFDENKVQDEWSDNERMYVSTKIKTKYKIFGFIQYSIEKDRYSKDMASNLQNISDIVSQFIETDFLLKELSSSQEIYQTVIDQSMTGICIFQDNTIKYCNRTFANEFKYELPQIIQNVSIYELFTENSQKHLKTAIDHHQKKKTIGIYPLELQGVRRDGVIRWFTTHISPIEFLNRPALLFNLMDITLEVENNAQKEKMTQLLIQSKKMETIQNLVSGISHEFNNIFAIIKGYIELIHLSIRQHEKDSQNLQDIESIVNAVGRGIKITNRLHIFIKHNQITMHPVKLDDYLNASMPLFMNIVRKHSGAVRNTTQISPDATEAIVDEYALDEILYNLYQNALDAIPDTGEITIRTYRINPNYIAIDFIDSGIGIPYDNLQQIFDPFFTTKAPNKGEGLGLYIVYQLSSAMGGRVEIDSEVGKGTVVKLIFSSPAKT